MVCLGLEPGAAVWKAQTNPLSNGGTPENRKENIESSNLLTTSQVHLSCTVLTGEIYYFLIPAHTLVLVMKPPMLLGPPPANRASPT